jgi:hypothetical protein
MAVKKKRTTTKKMGTKKSPAQNRAPGPLDFDPGTVAGGFTAAYVEKLQRMLDLEFDPAWLAFLKDHNGGTPRQRYFKLGRNTKVLEFFFSLVPDYENDERFGQVDVGVVWSQIEDRLDEHLVPFAAVFAGDMLCFNHEEGGPPRVVLWDHERSEEDSPVTLPVADDFASFLSLLFEE